MGEPDLLEYLATDSENAGKAVLEKALGTEFVIADDDAANWALRKIQKIEREMMRIDEQAEAEIERINLWRKQNLVGLASDRAFFESKLTAFHRFLQAQGAAGKTYKLPAGELKSRAQQPKITIENQEQLIQWLKENDLGDLVTVKESVGVSALKPLMKGERLVTDEGEIVKGAFVEVPEGDSYSVAVAK